jgi:hypothetical protein
MARRVSAIRLLDALDGKRLSALINFVNVKLESVDPLRKIFTFAPGEYMKSGQRARVPLVRWAATLEELRGLQREMRKWLRQIAAEKRVGQQVRAKVDEWLEAARTTDARAAGPGRITVRLELDSPRAQCMYALLLLRDTEGLAKQVGHCPWCGRYFFVERIRTGPPNKFCPGTQHRNSYYQYPHNNDGKYRPTPELP